MSPWSAKPLVLGFGPEALEWGGRRMPCDSTYGAEPWQGALACVEELKLEKTRVTIELGNALVRYALIPWSDALSTPAEEDAYVRHHFARIHGERAKAWTLRASEAAAGEARLASAVDTALIEALKTSFVKKASTKLVSIQPALMRRFNAVRRSLPDAGAWLVLAEPGRACVALHGRRGWRSVQNAKGEWRALLERERHRVEGEVPALVLLGGAAAPANDESFRFKAITA